MEWIATKAEMFTTWYTTTVEPWLDGMSNGETALYLALIPAFLIWLGRKLYKLFQKEPTVARMEPAEYGEQPPQVETSTPDTPPHSVNSTQATKPLPHTSNTKLFGRKKELTMLTRAWKSDKQNIVVLKAMGGTGKTALLKTWVDGFNDASKRTPYDKIFQWSFYSQGSAEDKQASADEFFDRALRFFAYQGDDIVSAHDKGMQLAALINQQRTLLVLDGLEPLQYPSKIMHGDLKDKGLQALLRQLAIRNQGLCLISSRQQVVELANKPLVVPYDLEQLETDDGVALLNFFGCTGSKADLEQAVKDVSGHALTLILLGNYIKTVYQGDIRQRDRIKDLTKERDEGKHAEKVMAAYERHLQGTSALSILYLMGLFDRPASLASIQHLRDANIPQLSDQLDNKTKWQYALADLRQQQLLNSNDPAHPDTVDTHPLIREYFGKQLQQTAPDAWQQAHRLLYHYYKDLPEKQQPDTLQEMEPLFAAIAHGCAAGMHQQALEEVYYPRIQRDGKTNYLCNKLGAFGADLSALSHFFSQHWQTPIAELEDNWKAAVLNWAAFRLRALGRLQEAVEPMQAGLEMPIKKDNWKNAAIQASSLSELQLTRGAVSPAIKVAQQSVELADKSDDAFQRMARHTTLADAQHQAGELANAQQLFQQAEALQKEWQAEYPQLYSLQGFRYCDYLLTVGQWQQVQQRAEYALRLSTQYLGLLDIALDQLSLGRASLQQTISSFPPLQRGNAGPDAPAWECRARRSSVGMQGQTLQRGNAGPDAPASSDDSGRWSVHTEFPCWSMGTRGDGSIGTKQLDKANLAALQTAKNWLDKAVNGLRKAGAEEFIVRGLLARAYYYRIVARMELAQYGETVSKRSSPVLRELHTGYGSALQDLQEVYDIAQRGGMLLFLTDYHLEATRLLFDTAPFGSAQGAIPALVNGLSVEEHIEEAQKLIKKTGYKRRLPELEYLQNYLSTADSCG